MRQPLDPAARPARALARLAIAAMALLPGACSREAAKPEAPASHGEAMTAVSGHWARKRWAEAFAACDLAFKYADRAGDTKAIPATECAGEAAARMGKPGLALPHHERLFEAYAETLRTSSARHRLANNYGVLLVEAGRRAEAIEVLREALDIYAGTPYHIGSRHSFPARALITRNLARAWYESASDPEARDWVRQQGAAFLEHMETHERSVNLSMGASAALDALAAIGRRQALMETPAWEAMARRWEPLEAGIDARSPQLARGCEMLPLREVLLEVCMRELPPPG